jgi:O-antigen/teichoic acid export membrane protein
LTQNFSLKTTQRFSFGVALTLASRFLMAANSVVSGIIVARWLGAEGLGAVATLSVAISTTVLISSLGMGAANTYFVAKENKLAATAVVNSALFALLSGSIFAAGLFACAIWQPGLLANLPGKLVAVSLLALPFHLATALGINLFLALGRVTAFNALDLISQSFVVVNAIIALVILQEDLWTLVSLNTAAAAGSALLTFTLLYRFLAGKTEAARGRWRADFAGFWETLRYALKGQVLWVAMLLVLRVDLVIVAYLRGAAEAGVYAVASQFTLFLLLLPTAVSQLLLARVSATNEAAADFTCRAARHTTLFMLLACAASVPLSLFLPLVYGPAFAETPRLIWLLLPGIFFMSVQSVLVQFFVGTGLPRLIPVSWLIMLALNIALNLLIVPRWGAYGAAAVSTLTYSLIFCLVFLYFRSQTHRGSGDILVLRSDELRPLLRLRHS